MAESAPAAAEFHAPGVHGFLHSPASPARHGLVLTHGAGSNCRAPLLVAAAEAFADAGFTVLRCDLPFRQARPTGPPPGHAAAGDRAGLPRLHTRALFVHGLRDPFGTPDELRAALTLIPAPTQLLLLPGGHDLRSFPAHAPAVTSAFLTLAHP